MPQRLETFAEFWVVYLGEHSRPGTRAVHIAGSSAALVFVAFAALRGAPSLLVPALLVGYAAAWTSHAFIEHNRPATFRYPVWSFLADWKMWGLAVTGQLPRELKRVGIAPSS